MTPAQDEIARSAYDRWLRRGCQHGFDREDWLAAEHDLMFRLNYRVLERGRLDQPLPSVSRASRRCRFCERTWPQVGFGQEPHALPGFLALAARCVQLECDDCRSQFRDSLDSHLARFAAPFLGVPVVQGLAAHPSFVWSELWGDDEPRHRIRPDGLVGLTLPTTTFTPIAAYKGLARLALGMMPESVLGGFAGALEWVSNPDHRLDRGAFEGLGCQVYLAPVPFAGPWASFAQKVDPDERVPDLLFFLGAGHVLFQIAVPLGQGDEDFDGEPLRLPAVTLPGSLEAQPFESPLLEIPLSCADPVPGGALELVYHPGALQTTERRPPAERRFSQQAVA